MHMCPFFHAARTALQMDMCCSGLREDSATESVFLRQCFSRNWADVSAQAKGLDNSSTDPDCRENL